jgi:hypothetical protein
MENLDILNIVGENEAYANKVCNLIKDIVCCYYNLPPTAYHSRSRVRQVIKMKQTAVYFIKKSLPKATLQYIGKHVNYDHATVLYSIKQINNHIETDKETKRDIDTISKAVQIENDRLSIDGDLQKEYYYINLNSCKSTKLESGRGIVFSGFSDKEADAIIKKIEEIYNEQISIKEHKNTGLFILEKNN